MRSFRGDNYQIGKQKGEIYKRNGMDFSSVKIDTKYYTGQLQAYKKYYPEMLDELEGVAEACEFDKEKIIYRFITGEIRFYLSRLKKQACTIFGVQNNNGCFVGRNYDWSHAADKTFEVYEVHTSGKNNLIAVSDMGIGPGGETDKSQLNYYEDDAINSKGLFIGLTYAYNDKWSFGISNLHMIRFLSERCSTVDEALALFKEIPICCPKNYFIADKSGKMGVVEHTSKRFKVLYPNKGVLIQTNHYIDKDLSEEDLVLEQVPYHNTFLRYYETLQKINLDKENFGFANIIKILGLKSYIYQNFPGVKTNWSLALDMTRGIYKIYWNLQSKMETASLVIN